MNYPVWELEFGPGLLIAIVAILHVYVSHFAIGGGLFLVVTEHFAYRKGDEALRNYLVTHSRFFILLTLVFGAISGVGIWFTIGLISPAGTSALIHIFLWGWAIEWALFLVEIAAAILYYQTWDRIPRKTHLAVGWVYFGAAFLSLVVVNGIVAFMLTPGDWLDTRQFTDGFFNPTYWPSLWTRSAICVALAGVYALLTGTFIQQVASRARLVRYAGIWAFVGVSLTIPAMAWYHHRLPMGRDDLFAGAQPAAALAADVLGWVGVALLALLLLPILFPRHFGKTAAVVVATVALVGFGAGEWVREAVRKPYVINGYLYANGLRPDESIEMAASGGVLANALWVETRNAAPEASVGKDIFRVVCRSCHTLGGYNGLREPLAGLDEEFVFELIGRLDLLRGQMPPFPGTDLERRAVAKYLVGEAGEKTLADVREVFEKRCGTCHTEEGFRPLYDLMDGYIEEDIIDLLPLLGEMTDEMAPWSGTDEEANQLAQYLLSWYPAEENVDGN